MCVCVYSQGHAPSLMTMLSKAVSQYDERPLWASKTTYGRCISPFGLHGALNDYIFMIFNFICENKEISKQIKATVNVSIS